MIKFSNYCAEVLLSVTHKIKPQTKKEAVAFELQLKSFKNKNSMQCVFVHFFFPGQLVEHPDASGKSRVQVPWEIR